MGISSRSQARVKEGNWACGQQPHPVKKKCILAETDVPETIIGDDEDDTSQENGQMTDVNQTLRGADTPTVDCLKPKEGTKISCWNVKALYQTGKLGQVVRENYGLDIRGVCEPRWTGSGQRTLAS